MKRKSAARHAWTDDETEKVTRWCADGVAFEEQARRLGLDKQAVQNKATRLGIGNGVTRKKGRPPAAEELELSKDASRALSVEDIVRLFKVDLTKWEATHVSPVVWEMGAKHPDTGELLNQRLYRTKVTFRRIQSDALANLRAQLIADVRRAAKGRRPAPVRPRRSSSGAYMLELDVFDVHLGKLAWAAETGHDYDSAITVDIVRETVADLLEQARPYHIERVLLPFGNDFFQADNLKGETTAGTRVDHDTRFAKMFRAGRELAAWMIETCAAIAPVHVPVVPGNHDEQTAFCMGVVLEAQFARDKRVTFDNSPRPRKYYRYGGNLLGFTHGKDEAHHKLPALMSLECKEEWARTTCREFHIGHLHTGRKTEPISVDDQLGVTVRWIRSLSGTDAWHAKKGFVGNQRNAESFLWRRDGGLRAHFVSEPIAKRYA
jgi:hypothetical protein